MCRISLSLAHACVYLLFPGDDTWTKLFPHSFRHSFPYPSFNVKDLHTVDQGCLKHLPAALRANDTLLTVAHFLGL
jgi:phosphatidylinositol glycan class O